MIRMEELFTRQFMTPDEIRETDIGLDYEEHLEMAYENMLSNFEAIQRRAKELVEEIDELRESLEELLGIEDAYEGCNCPDCKVIRKAKALLSKEK